MQGRRAFLMSGGAALALAACTRGREPQFLTYEGPAVTQVVVQKEQRHLFLMHDSEVLFDTRVGLGFAPVGHKQFYGDGRTPEGAYFIDRRNPKSRYHLSIGVSYPNDRDRAVASALGKHPGGDIFIHGIAPGTAPRGDWTVGCIAVDNAAMEKIYAMVPNGTPIYIYP